MLADYTVAKQSADSGVGAGGQRFQVHLATEAPRKIYVDFFDSDRLSDYLSSSDEEDGEESSEEDDRMAVEPVAPNQAVDAGIEFLLAELEGGVPAAPVALSDDPKMHIKQEARHIKSEPRVAELQAPADCGLRDLTSPPTTLEELMDTCDVTAFETFLS